MKENRILKCIWVAIRTLLSVGIFALAAYLLYRYEYFSQFDQVDNIVGAIPVAFILIIVVGAWLLLWVKPKSNTPWQASRLRA
jgi:hypothetical protein